MAILCANLDTLEPVEVRVATQIGIDTGRRPEDILALPLNCLNRDKDGAAVLVYDNAKADRLGRRLPISEATAAVIIGQQQRVRAMFPDTPVAELALLPTTRRNPHGRTPISIDTLDARHREWVSALPILRTRDGLEFDKTKIVPYVYRHCYAQRHADAGVPIDVLAELLDHRSYSMTRRYYRIGEDRRRAAVDTVTALSFDRHGNRIWRDAHMLLESERARHAVGEVAVPYGTCTEPTNVKAGGGACPVRFRCVGCDHFRTNIAFLPDLQAYLDDLLRTRERLAAAIDGVDDWARADATPTEEEITRIRRLINRIKGDIAELDDTERAQIDEAVAIVRRHRAAHGSRWACPSSPPPRPHHRSHPLRRPAHDHLTEIHTPASHHAASDRCTTAAVTTRCAGASASWRHSTKPLPTGDRISTSGIARAAGVDRTFLYRHRDLMEKIHALQADPAPGDHIGPAVTRASLQADLLAAHERAARLNARIQHLEKRLSRSARRTDLARVRARRPGRHRRTPPAHQPARTAQPRPTATTRRTRRRPRRSPRRQPRTHGPTQHANPAAMTLASRGFAALAYTCQYARDSRRAGDDRSDLLGVLGLRSLHPATSRTVLGRSTQWRAGCRSQYRRRCAGLPMGLVALPRRR